jgi:hypothetical protein
VDQPVFLDLPAGEAALVDIHYDDANRWFVLQCGTEDPPEDRWLSIAETFEFLP